MQGVVNRHAVRTDNMTFEVERRTTAIGTEIRIGIEVREGGAIEVDGIDGTIDRIDTISTAVEIGIETETGETTGREKIGIEEGEDLLEEAEAVPGKRGGEDGEAVPKGKRGKLPSNGKTT